MVFFTDFHARGVIHKSLNATFLCLIPKMARVDDITKFRPISLVGSVYKIMAKVLASRLRKVVGKVVSPNQHAFISGRQTLDASLIANECIDFYPKSNQSGYLASSILRKLMTMFLRAFLWLLLRRWAF